ncbi:transcriptional regulatory moc3 [Fusarium subglutinans]|uniref:Transcriptional regulatory moc3 n=1 Tax=Gibberella subglutinans TaxID=42677 RepID=A0A8H5KIW2_GIBSU|nr:transcriptional regulatory moc3 [Fusarium subglutinans]KAF5575054.1 transcriptional regulatory moc3 [Fusarium subglutinans]
MGRLRSRNGCLTCRKRRVKCTPPGQDEIGSTDFTGDETRPTCGVCLKRDQLCRWDDPSPRLKIKQYRPKHVEDSAPSEYSFYPPERDIPLAERDSPPLHPLQQPDSVWCPETLTSPTSAASILDLSQHESPNQYSGDLTTRVSRMTPVPPALQRQEAFYLHHFSTHVAQWLDCTDASRQFMLNVTVLARSSPILLYAIISYAARHLGDNNLADEFQEKCIVLLIPLLSTETIAHDETILCAIVILRVCEQLSVTVTGGDEERHLAGLSALLKASQGQQVDPSAPTLSQAAFWVYVRQSFYNACINQQPPNLNFDLVLIPPPSVIHQQAVDAKAETAWANTMAWICATVMQFCFGGSVLYPESSTRMQRWYELSEAVENWNKTKPGTFDPIWSGETGLGADPFPEIWFTADWHGRHKFLNNFPLAHGT